MRGKKPTEPFDFKLICLSLEDGSVKWKRSLAREQPKYAIHPSNTYATESPATDGKHVFCYFAAIGKVASVDLEGKLVWAVNVGAFPSGNGFGTGSSLTRRDGNLYIQCDNDKNSFVVALDAATGKEIWKRKRSSRTSWATPFIWKHGKRTDLVICGSGTVTGYDPATGKINWRLTNTRSAFTASPASDGKYIFLGNSGPFSRGPLMAIGSEIAASMWAYDKHVFLLDESGKTFVIKAGSYFKIIRENELDDLFWSTPAVTNGALLLRGSNNLYCIRKKKLLNK